MKHAPLIAVWLVPSLLLLLLTGYNTGVFAADDMHYRFAQEQANVMDAILDRYVEKISEEELYELAMAGMIQAVGEKYGDRYSRYLNKASYKRLTEGTTGSYVGVGIEFDTVADKRLIVRATIEGSPAFKVDVLPGDEIIAVDGTEVSGLTLAESIGLIKGKKGESVILTLKREGLDESIKKTVVRDDVIVPSVRGTAIIDRTADVGYLRIRSFDQDTDEEVRTAITRLFRLGARSLVIDLRGNGGGDFKSCRGVIDLFVSEGEMVRTEVRNGGEAKPEIFKAQAKGTVVDAAVPVVVLINGRSASASEVVAGALQDRSRAKIVGVPSFGKGSVQHVLPLGRDKMTALKLTTAHWIRPNGKRTTKENPVKPDVTAEIEEKVWLEILKKRALGDRYERPDWLEVDPVDTQLARAIALLSS